MIKINTKSFDWLEINKIYIDPKGRDWSELDKVDREEPAKLLIEPLKGKIQTQYDKTDTHRIVKHLLEQWFYEGNKISYSKIANYLREENFEERISAFEEAKSSIIEEKDKRFSGVLITWPEAKQKAIIEINRAERKNIITAVIKPENCHMFDGITKNDLGIEPERGTIYSDKEKIKKIKMKYDIELEIIIKELTAVFDYKNLSKEFRHKLLTAMHIEVCPYCNRQYITNYKMVGESRSTADIDHFYSQSRYPFLALSLYNFIPSCQICNSRFKLSVDFGKDEHINPHKRGFDKDGVFRLKGVESLLGGPIEFEIVNVDNREEIENSLKTFRLNEVYQTHQDYVGELVKKAQIYNDGQLTEYLENFCELFESKNEMHRIIFGNYVAEEELGKRPLAKLTKDLLDDLGIKIRD